MRTCPALPPRLAQLIGLGFGLCIAAPALGQQLMIPESSTDQVMLFDPVDGSLIDANFIDLRSSGSTALIPIEAIVVDDEIWITDQVADAVMRFSQDGSTFLGKLEPGLDNARGIASAAGRVFLANGALPGPGGGDAIKELSAGGALIGSHPAVEPYDLLAVGDEILVSNVHDHDIERYDLSGNFLGIFHDSDGVTGINFPEQLTRRRSNGNVLAAGFSTPAGIYEYSIADGSQVGYFDVGSSVRGVFELLDGNFLFTDAAGVHVYDPASGAIADVITGVSARLIGVRGELPTGAPYCVANANSTGSPALLAATGSPSILDNQLTLRGEQLPAGTPAILFYGTTQLQAPLGGGVRCVGGRLYRFPLGHASAAGSYVHPIDLTLPPSPGGRIQPGSIWNFQLWYRDPGASSTANLSDAVEIAFTP